MYTSKGSYAMSWRKTLWIFNVWLFTTVLLSCIQLTKAGQSCSFDDGLCFGWSQSNQDDFDWTNKNGLTPSKATGPTSDHSGYGSYMYIETSSPRQYKEKAKLQFSVSSSDIGKLSCLKFYYHMYGATINTLNVYNGNTRVFTKRGNQGNKWLFTEITLTLQSRVSFQGIRGRSFTGDIAIDDMSIVNGSCQASLSCDFDSGLCDGWQQSQSDVFDWTRRAGSTSSPNTGPNKDHTSGSGSYMYIESSPPRQHGDNAKLEFLMSSSIIGKLSCLKFYYHMYGDTINTLNVYNGNTKMFSKSGNKGNEWSTAEITMTLQNKITFEGITGTSFTGDIAIDDVSVVEGMCQDCTEVVNKSFGRLDISYTSKFAPYCNWIVGNAGIPQAVAVVSIHQMKFAGAWSEYVKIFDGNGTMVFAVHGWDSASFKNSLQHILFGESKNIMIQVSLTNSRSYVKIDYGTLKQRLNSASILVDWNVAVVNKTAKSMKIIWSHPTNLLSGGIRFYFALARKTNSSSETTGELVAENTTASKIKGLNPYTEYKVGVVAVDGYGTPFKSESVLVMTDEGVPSRAPNGVRVTSFDFKSDLFVEWNPLPQNYANGKLLGYRICFKEDNSLPLKIVDTSSLYPTPLTLEDLKPAHVYLIAVAAFTSKGVGPLSRFKISTTGCSTTFNETFGQIELTTTSNNDLRCIWNIHGAGIRYAFALISVQELNLYYCEFVKIINGNGTVVPYHLGCPSSAPEILASVPFGLSNNISVQVYTQKYGSSIKIEFAILKNGLTSAIPVWGWNVTILNITPNSLTLQWTKLNTVVNHYAKFYIVEVKSTQGTILTVKTTPKNVTTKVIKRLSPSKKYRVSVFGIDGIGQPYKSLEGVATTGQNIVYCGSRPSSTRIVGGTVAPVNSWPWQVMLRHSSGSQFCGGSLVNPYWVVTAAHCMVGETPSSVMIRLGAHYRAHGSVETEQDIGVAKIIMHESYKIPLEDSNDIALIYLLSPAVLGKGVGLVCLPDTGHHLPFDNLDKKCWITGWGDLYSEGSPPNRLRQASVPLVSEQRCTSVLPGYIDDSMLCAGFDSGGVDACQGDSGGPLVCEFNGTWYLEGVTSWGLGCAEPNRYGVYAKVRNLKLWLLTNMDLIVAPVVSPQNQSSPSLDSCSFVDGLCLGWSQSDSDIFDWTLNSGSTPSSSTGPSSDLSVTGKYMYVEATGRSPGDNAKLQLAVPRSNTSSCLTFYYHMYGSSMGTLNVFNGNVTIFSKSGDQGNHWVKVTRTLNLSDVLTFEGIVGLSFRSDIAIDNITLSGVDCPVSCDFDSRLCDGWRQSNSDVFNWTRHTGSTLSFDTGPDGDHNSGSGYYMYIEASSPRVTGDNAKLKLSVSGNEQLSCLQFYYHMYGDSMGTLTVFSGNAVVFNTSGNHGYHWIKSEITISLDNTVTFEGIVGTSYTGDLAIDDVSISSGSCQGHTAPPTFPTASTSEPSFPSVSSMFTPSSDKPSLSSSRLPDTSMSTLTPKTPSLKETQESIMLEVGGLDIKKWDEQIERDFKRKVANAATDFCAADGSRCQFTPTSSRRKRSSNNMVFTSDMVHILPTFPKKSPDDPTITLLAFYLQLPQGFFDSVVNKDVLKAIVESDKSSIEGSMGGTILSVQPLASTDTPEINDESDDESKPTGVIIGASLGPVLMLIIIGILVWACKRSNRFSNLWAKKKDNNSNSAYFNNAYNMGSGEEDIEMKCNNPTSSPGYMPDQKPEEDNCATINDPPPSTNQSTAEVILKFPEAISEENSEGVATFNYRPLDS